MKCKLNPRIKYEIQIAVLMIGLGILLTIVMFGLVYIIGYISVHPFSIDFMFLDVKNDTEYYITSGLMLMFVVTMIVSAIFIMISLIKNIISIAKNPKDFYNSIFICENKDDN